MAGKLFRRMEKRGARPVLTLSALAAFLVAGIGGVIYAAFATEPSSEDPTVVTGSLTGTTAAPDSKTSPTARPAGPAAQGTDAHVRGVVRLYRTKAPVEGLEL